MTRVNLERLGHYEIVRRLAGDDGQAYLARDRGRECVLTLVDLDADGVERLAREVSRCDRLRHRAVVPVLDLFSHEARHVLAFERIAGASLSDLGRQLEEQGDRLAPSALCHLGYELACALAEAHGQREGGALVHPRLEPEHVVISWNGDVRLLGFGTSVVFARRPLGPFAAPEVRAGGAPTPRANAYSLAALLWWLTTGKSLPEPPVPPLAALAADLAPEVIDAIDAALRVAPDERSVGCAELAELIEPHVGSGKEELRWNMEVLRAIGGLGADAPPTSEAFPSSARPASAAPSSDEPATREVQLPGYFDDAVARPSSDPPSDPPKKRQPRKRATLESSVDELVFEPSPVRTEIADGDMVVQSVRGQARPSDSAIVVTSTDPPPSDAPTAERDATALLAQHGVVASEEAERDLTKRRSIDDLRAEAAAAEAAPAATTEESVTQLRPMSELVAEHAQLVVSDRDTSVPVPPSGGPGRASAEPLISTVAPPPQARKKLIVAIAVATVTAFAAGMVVARGLFSSPASQPSSDPAPAGSSAGAPGGESGPPVAPASAESSMDPAPSSELAPGFAHLIAVSTVADAGVYVFGDYRGPPNKPIAVRCDRTVFVRLGTVPPRHWYTAGRSLFVRCGEVTRVSLEPVVEASPDSSLPTDL